MKTKILTPQSIIDRLNEIQEWINKNGFSNRGLHSAGDSAKELENALAIVLTASDTLHKWENTYMHFYVEKTVTEHPEFAKKWANRWERIHNNWDDDPEFLYNRAVEYNQHINN